LPVLSTAPALEEHEVAADLIKKVIDLTSRTVSDLGEEFADQ
jgi:hypothetical protein